MIFVLTKPQKTQTKRLTHTHKDVAQRLKPFKIMAYETAFRQASLPFATYIFTDFDRLDPHSLELAADLYRLLEKAGCKVLNDPARVLQRYALLKRLQTLGINDFAAWRADEGVLPDKSPVFLRTQASHRGVLSDLLHTTEEMQGALEKATDERYPLADLIFIEYRAEPKEGVFWKHSVHRIGDRLFAGPSVIDLNWVAKNGIKGLASDEQLRAERQLVLDGTYAEALRPAFDAGEIRYGRADFGIINGRIAVYEINTNPLMKLDAEHHSPIRVETLEHVRRTYLDAMVRINEASGKKATITLRSKRFRGNWPHRLRKSLKRSLRKRIKRILTSEPST